MNLWHELQVFLNNESGVNLLEYIVIAGYLVFMVLIGILFTRLNRDTGDYFRSGSKGSWWMVGTSAYMAGTSAYTFTAASGIAYYAGWSVLMIYLCNPIIQSLSYKFYAAKIRRKRLTTAGEVYRERFNPATQQTYSIIGLLTGFVGSGMNLYTLGIFVAAVFGLNIYLVIVVLGAVVLFYSISGGRWAVMATDFLQMLVMFTMAVLMTVLCLYEIGGLGELFRLIQEHGLASDYSFFTDEERFLDTPGYRGYFTWKWWVALLVVNFLGAFSVGAVNYSVKDDREAEKGVLLFIVLALLGSLFFFLPPMVSRILYPAEVEALTQLAKPGDGSYAVACFKLLPPGMVGLMVVAMFAAAMSSMDSALNGGAGNFVLNVYPPLARICKWKERTPEQMLIFSKLYCLATGLLAIGLSILYSYNRANPLQVLLVIGSLLGLPMTVPMFWGLVLKRMPQWTPIITMIIGFIVAAAIHLNNISFKIVPHIFYHEQVALIVGAGTLTVLISMLFARNNPAEYNRRVDAFYERMNTPVDFAREVGASNDKLQLRILGRSAVAGGLFIMLLVLAAQDIRGVICPLAVGGFIAGLGWFMLFVSRRLKDDSIPEKTGETSPTS